MYINPLWKQITWVLPLLQSQPLMAVVGIYGCDLCAAKAKAWRWKLSWNFSTTFFFPSLSCAKDTFDTSDFLLIVNLIFILQLMEKNYKATNSSFSWFVQCDSGKDLETPKRIFMVGMHQIKCSQTNKEENDRALCFPALHLLWCIFWKPPKYNYLF